METKSRDILAEPRWTASQISPAAGVSDHTIRTWFKREILTVSKNKMGLEAEGAGLARKLSGYAAMMIAIMGKLTSGSMSPDDAKKVASHFVFVGEDGRLPCYPFQNGETLLVIPKNAPQGIGPKVINVASSEDVALKDLFRLFNNRTDQIEILRMEALWQSVFQKLGIRAELEARGGA